MTQQRWVRHASSNILVLHSCTALHNTAQRCAALHNYVMGHIYCVPRTCADASSCMLTAVLHCTTLHCTALHYTTLHYTLHHTLHHSTPLCPALHCTAQHCTAQHGTAQHSTALHSAAQHSTARHGTALNRVVPGPGSRAGAGILSRASAGRAGGEGGSPKTTNQVEFLPFSWNSTYFNEIPPILVEFSVIW